MLDLRKHLTRRANQRHNSIIQKSVELPMALPVGLAAMTMCNPDRAAILITIAIMIFPFAPYITLPLGILAYLWIRYLKYVDAKNATTREQISSANASPPP